MKSKIYTKEFKSKIVLETLKGEMTLAQICSKFGTSPRSVKDWRRRAIKGLSSLFETGKTTKPDAGDAFLSELYEQIGRMKIENDRLKRGILK